MISIILSGWAGLCPRKLDIKVQAININLIFSVVISGDQAKQ